MSEYPDEILALACTAGPEASRRGRQKDRRETTGVRVHGGSENRADKTERCPFTVGRNNDKVPETPKPFHKDVALRLSPSRRLKVTISFSLEKQRALHWS